jgi:structural maintenance of chromosome 3 (chondroitin sulfate proteoglycan 6)
MQLDELKVTESSESDALEEAKKTNEKLLNKRMMLMQKREESMRKIQQLGSLPGAELDAYKDLSIKELMNRLTGCNQKMGKYSHVNKKALDQYVNFTEQRQTLVERKKELDQGAEAIEDLISTLDRQKEEAIMRTFRGVSHHFSDVFKELVPTGNGQLVMKQHDSEKGKLSAKSKSKSKKKKKKGGGGDDDDELEGMSDDHVADDGSDGDADEEEQDSSGMSVSEFKGVQVKVKFAGTGEQFLMQQLSGGQKALVALALIFAIQRSDPAPFYLFDEIDQALDSTYRAAVAALIQRQTNSATNPAQFITTTFRPELVHVATKHYGIGLQNKNSNIHAFSKQESLAFVAELMNEEEAVEGVAPVPTSGVGKRRRRD